MWVCKIHRSPGIYLYTLTVLLMSIQKPNYIFFKGVLVLNICTLSIFSKYSDLPWIILESEKFPSSLLRKKTDPYQITESSAKSGARFKVESFPTKELSVLVHECGRGFESHRLTLIFLLLYLLFIFSNSVLELTARPRYLTTFVQIIWIFIGNVSCQYSGLLLE